MGPTHPSRALLTVLNSLHLAIFRESREWCITKHQRHDWSSQQHPRFEEFLGGCFGGNRGVGTKMFTTAPTSCAVSQSH